MHIEVLPKATAAAQGSSWQTCILSNVAVFDAPNKIRAFIGKNALRKVNTSKQKLSVLLVSSLLFTADNDPELTYPRRLLCMQTCRRNCLATSWSTIGCSIPSTWSRVCNAWLGCP